MNNIKLNVKHIVEKKLNQTRTEKLNESFYKIKDKNGIDLIKSYFITSKKLMNEGYTIDEIEKFLFEQESSTFDFLKNVDWKKEFTSGLWETIKEMGLYWIITSLFPKMDKSTAMNLARFWTNVTPLDLLRPFKDKEHCIKYGPKLLDGLSEVLVRWALQNLSGASSQNETWGDIANVFLGNQIGSIIEKTDSSETIANKLCPMIHD